MSLRSSDISIWNTPRTFGLGHVSCTMPEGHFTGHGVLRWHPEKGHRLEASGVVDRSSAAVVPTAQPLPDVRMRLTDGGWGIGPEAKVQRDFDSIRSGWFSADLGRVVRGHRTGHTMPTEHWRSGCTLIYDGREQFPDSLTTAANLAGGYTSESWSMSGLSFINPDLSVHGVKGRDNYIELSADLSTGVWTRAQAWRWPEAARLALSILLNQDIALIERSAYLGPTYRVEFRRRTQSLGLYGCGPFCTTSVFRLNKDWFVALSSFLARCTSHARLCWYMFSQMTEAARQHTLRAQLILQSSVLEATLRTIDEHPFRQGDHSWKIDESMTRFRLNYLTDEWQPVCRRAPQFYAQLRHQNSHPDWFFGPQDARLSDRHVEECWGQVAFLSRFYGQMILALAGVKDLDPSCVADSPYCRGLS